MAIPSASLLDIEPYVRRARSGWLAASRSGSTLIVGVIADDEEGARKAFEIEVQAWIPLFEQAALEASVTS